MFSFSGGQTTACCFDAHTWPCAPFLLGSPSHIPGDSQTRCPRQKPAPRATRNAKLLPASHSQGRRGSVTRPTSPKCSIWHLASREVTAWLATWGWEIGTWKLRKT